MNTSFIVCICSMAVALAAFGQSPTAAPAAGLAQSPAPATSVAPTAGATSSNDLADKIQQRIEKKLGHKGLHFQIGDEDESDQKGAHSGGDIPHEVIPIVAISLLTVFGAPVLIVGVIMYFGFSRNRMMHRTIRMMVEKGQPVPAALLAPPPPAVRQRSDMRRGVVLVMVGLGLMVFLGAVNDWEGGAWAVGIIPLLIGAGYLLVWKLEGGEKVKTDNPPPLP